jgi:hypothetical protein
MIDEGGTTRFIDHRSSFILPGRGSLCASSTCTTTIAPEVVSFLERGARFETRIIERDGGRFFLVGTATRHQHDDAPETRIADMDAEGVGQAVLRPFIMYLTSRRRGLAIASQRRPRRSAAHPTASCRWRPCRCSTARRAKEPGAGGKLGVRGVDPPKVGEQGLTSRNSRSSSGGRALGMVVCIHLLEAAPTDAGALQSWQPRGNPLRHLPAAL